MASETDKRVIDVVINGQKATASLKELDAAAAVLYQQFRKMSADDPGRAKLLGDYNELKGRIAGVRAEMGQATQTTSFLKQGFANAFALFTGGGLLSMVQNVWGVLTSAREEYAGSARITADLENTLRSTQNAAGLTADEIKRIGEERAKVTLFDDDMTNQASAMLLTFTNIKKGVFEEAIPAIQDIATKMAGDGPADLKGASIQVGKALNDPIKGITALTRVGVTFTEQQKEQITQMVKAGDTAGAQQLILAELNKEFGGSAEAARKAAGGMATLSMRWGEMKESVGELVQGGLDKFSNFLGLVLDKSQPLVDVFMEFGQELGVYYDKVMDLVSGLGLFSSEGDMATSIVNFLAEAIRFLLTPVRVAIEVVGALIDGFVSLYNKSELVRGVLGGLVAVVVTTFKTIKDDALKYLGGVGDFLVGIFTLDPEKIKSGLKKTFEATSDVVFASGMRNAKAFVEGYNANKDDLIVRKARVTTVATTETTRGGGLEAGGEPDADGPSQKELARAEKMREAAEKKAKAAQDRVDKARLDSLQDLVEQEEKLEDARIAAIQDKRQREIAQINLDAQRKGEELTGTEAQVAEQLLLINDERERKLQELAAKYQAEADKNREQQLEERMAQNQADAEVAVADLELKLATGVLDEQAYQDAVFAVKQAAAERDLAFIQQKSGAESLEYKKAAADKVSAHAGYVGKKKDLDNGMAVFEKGLANAKKLISSDEVDFLAQTLGKKSIIYKAAVAAQKALALVEIGIGLQKQIAANSEAGAKISASAPPVTVPLGIAYTIGTNVLAVAGAGIAVAKIAGFSGGGRTSTGSKTLDMAKLQISPSGEMVDENGATVAGLVHKNEYVIPEWLRADPKVVAVENWLEARRLRGYAEGGATSDGGRLADPAAFDAPSPLGEGEVAGLMREMLTELREQKAEMKSWQRELQVVFSLRRYDEARDLLKQVEFESKITG